MRRVPGNIIRHRQVALGTVELHVAELGSGPPVLFCHGFPDVWIGWRRQMEAVAAAGYRAIAIDMRGYGGSSGPDDPQAYTVLHAVGDLVGLLDALDLPQAALVAHDFGASTAWYAALLRPDRFPALFAISVPFLGAGSPSPIQRMREAGRNSFYMFRQLTDEAVAGWGDAAVSYPGNLYWTSGSPPAEDRWDPFDGERAMWRPAPVPHPDWADPRDVAYAVAEFTRTGFAKPLYWYHSAQHLSDLTAAFAGLRISQPVFFLWGGRDGLTHILPYSEDMLCPHVPGLVAAVRLDEAGHWPHREQPERTNGLLVSFLGSAYRTA